MTQDGDQWCCDPHVAEFYDQWETEVDDVELIRSLIGGGGPLKILEPFAGTGRIFIPLALEGHVIVGMERSRHMLDRARAKVGALLNEVRGRIELIDADVTKCRWPSGFDLVLLGGNCFYEVPSSEEQEYCVASAASALVPGGYVYVDNDHMEGELEESWRRPGVRRTMFPDGTCADGTRLEGTTEMLWSDAKQRLARYRRTITVTLSDGRVQSWEWLHQKHPPSKDEVEGMLLKHGFAVEKTFGDRAGNPYSPASPRAIFWARTNA